MPPIKASKAGQVSLFRQKAKKPIIVSLGLGVDSIGLLAGLYFQGVRPDLIIFADTSSEMPHTYAYKPILDAWLVKVGFPPITTVRYTPKNFKNWPAYSGLEENCLTNGTLPSIAFGFSSCSLKHKAAPIHSFTCQWQPALEAFEAGERCIKMIGYDNSPRDRQRTFEASTKLSYTHMYDYQYPLIEWKWDREDCQNAILKAGLPQAKKSSCFFCTSLKPHELEALPKEYLERIIRLEARAHPRLTKIEGLWRSTVKGFRGATPKPGSMTEYIRQKQLLNPQKIDHIWDTTPKEIISFQQGYAEAKQNGIGDEFLSENRYWDYRPSQKHVPWVTAQSQKVA